MMRKCHLNTCPVGIATQDPILRERFKGSPEHVINYLFFVAEELRAIMANLGFRTMDAMIGHTECIVPRKKIAHAKASTLDFSRVLVEPGEGALHCVEKQDHGLAEVLDHTLLEEARGSLKHGEPASIKIAITNADRTFGAMLAGEIARRHGAKGLPEGTVSIELEGTAGQSFGAFAAPGMLLSLEGDANDYVGKGLSGGVIAIRPPVRSVFRADENVIVGNTCLYGATSGKAFFAGRAGERFAVRNSGAITVVEGTGDHACEYMTGGIVVVLGTVGRNVGAGMSGGVAYVLGDPHLEGRINKQMVELEPLGREDADLVRGLIEEHVEHTRSVKGKELLASWSQTVTRFTKIMPTEWKKLLASRALAQKVV